MTNVRKFCAAIRLGLSLIVVVGLSANLLKPCSAEAEENHPAYGEKVLYTLCSLDNCIDGRNSNAGLIQDSAGNFYGTTWSGGASSSGTVFKVTKAGKETVLYSFTGGADGAILYDSLLRDKAGNLYGTTSFGGNTNCISFPSGCGTIFKLDKAGKLTVLHAFVGGTDGAGSYSGLIEDLSGNLYGATAYGGDTSCNPPYGCGTIFKVDKSGKETVLYSFEGSPDGESPYFGVLAMDSAGNLFGTTLGGGTRGAGTVFTVSQTGAEKVLHSFTGTSGDGASPYAGVILDSSGNLYGTTDSGGFGGGIVFKISQKGRETVLYSFFSGTDGAGPESGLIEDSAGNFYGTTWAGGSPGSGTVFKVTKNGAENVLRKFSGTDGLSPVGQLFRDGAGNLYGTTFYGGTSGDGVVFGLLKGN
jgi:uncharacterized repeat protein (TIGR03803 family)